MSPSVLLRLLLLSTSALSTLALASPSAESTSAHAEWLDTPVPGALSGEKIMKDVPSYVLDYAPLVHLSEEEIYWPSLVDDHLLHTTPSLNFTPVEESEQHPTASNLGDFNKYDDGAFVYLQSKDMVETMPAWLTSEKNIPVVQGAELEKSQEKSKKRGGKKHGSKTGGRSPAPAYLVVAEKDDGVVDAFWFFFYSYNLGNTVFGIGFGDHVGDWEHTVVRFKDGLPESMFVSEHAFGQTYTYDSLEKYGKRPVIYSGRGTHAMYVTPGIQAYVLPYAILHDTTSRGPLWDPSLNLLSYHYTSPNDSSDTSLSSFIPHSVLATEYTQNTLMPSLQSPSAPTSWFYFGGFWGDKEYPASDIRQYHAPIVGEKKFVDGPLGPRFKALGRRLVCPHDTCSVRTTIAPRLWVLDWLYNWAWTCGVFLALVLVGIVAVVVSRHAHRTHGRAWRWWQERRERRERRKLFSDVERSPLISEAASGATSVVSAEGETLGYGTISAVNEVERLDEHVALNS